MFIIQQYDNDFALVMVVSQTTQQLMLLLAERAQVALLNRPP